MHWPRDKCQWKSGRASEKFGVILVKLIDHSRKFPSGPVKKNPKFAACFQSPIAIYKIWKRRYEIVCL